MIQNMSKPVTILAGHFLPSSLLKLPRPPNPHPNTTAERAQRQDHGRMNSEQYRKLAYLGPDGLNSSRSSRRPRPGGGRRGGVGLSVDRGCFCPFPLSSLFISFCLAELG